MLTEKILEESLEEVSIKVNETLFNTQSQRKLSKKGYSFSTLPVEKQIRIWDKVWKSEFFWVKVQAFFYCEKLLKKPDDLVLIWTTIKEWQNNVNDWGTCDCLSKVYSRILEIKPKLVLPTLTLWNKSDNPWNRRQSIVSLLYYHSVRNNILPFDVIVEMIDNLKNDTEYYVQKGVGWSLRELYRAYPERTLAYLYKNAEQFSSTAFATISSKLDMHDKETLKQIRKKK